MARTDSDNGDNGDGDDNRIQYQFKISREKWEQWKKDVPRTKKLDERIIELIEEDTDADNDD